MEYVNSKEQIADIFTKPLPKDAFEYLRGKLGAMPLSKAIWAIVGLPCIKWVDCWNNINWCRGSYFRFFLKYLKCLISKSVTSMVIEGEIGNYKVYICIIKDAKLFSLWHCCQRGRNSKNWSNLMNKNLIKRRESNLMKEILTKSREGEIEKWLRKKEKEKSEKQRNQSGW